MQFKAGARLPSAFVDVKRIPELIGVAIDAGGLHLGAATPAAVLTEHVELRRLWPGLAEAVHLIGSVQIQGRGSVGGNLCNASPAADTTCALIVQENEPLLLADLCDRLRRFASVDEAYRHNELDVRTVNICGPDECANGHSHCQHALLGACVALPVAEGDVLLGRWQRVLLVELDHPRPRELTVQVTGIVPAGIPDDRNAAACGA